MSQAPRQIEIVERYDDQPLSVTDATSVALVDRHAIDTILTFDVDFDGIVERRAPQSLGDPCGPFGPRPPRSGRSPADP